MRLQISLGNVERLAVHSVAGGKVAMPTCSLDGGNYFEPQTIGFGNITCATYQAIILVSLDDGETWDEWSE